MRRYTGQPAYEVRVQGPIYDLSALCLDDAEVESFLRDVCEDNAGQLHRLTFSCATTPDLRTI